MTSTSEGDMVQHQILHSHQNDAESSTASISGLSKHQQPVEFVSRAIDMTPRTQTIVFARSSLSFYMELIYKLGICPYSEYQKICAGRLRKLRKISYVCLVVLVIFYEIRTIKFDVMEFFGKKSNIGRMIVAIFVAFYGINTMCLMHFLASKWEVMVESLRSLNFENSMYLGTTQKQLNQENKWAAQATLGVSVTLVTVLLITEFYQNDQWSIQGFVGYESYQIQAVFTIWRPKHWQNETLALWNEYWEDVSPMSITFGVLGGISNCCGWLQEHIVLDIMLLLNFALSQHMSRLIAIIQDEHASLDTKWEEYVKMRKLSDQINATFQYLLPLEHISSLFLFSYFLYGGFMQIKFVYIIMLGAKVGKILLTYFLASATAFKNKIIQTWVLTICEEGERVVIKGKVKQVPVLLKIAYHDLIGLGHDDFFISQKFLIMFFGTVGTVFLLLVDWNSGGKEAIE